MCGGWFDLRLRTPGDDGFRLLNAEHARLQASVIIWLQSLGWEMVPEASFSIFGERGVIDVLAWHPRHRAVLIIEIKTALVDVSELLATTDRRLRLALQIASDRGWAPLVVGAWVAVKDSAANRERLAANAGLVRAALPRTGGMWLRVWPIRFDPCVRLASSGMCDMEALTRIDTSRRASERGAERRSCTNRRLPKHPMGRSSLRSRENRSHLSWLLFRG
ncbi:MAG: hypothetical protein L0221_11515 [Chloroflexi bacterium]|nr:hypothetical protein [Chloroflexota bacterium]